MSIKLSGVPPIDGEELPSGSYIPAAIYTGLDADGNPTFTLRAARLNQVGASGPKGDTGSRILSGAGAPAVTLGNDEDYYINTATGEMSYKTAGAWSVITSVLGPAGPAGAAGADGVDGADGAVGPAGPAGANGADGADAVPAGASGDLQYNDGAGALAAESALNYDFTNDELHVDGNVRGGVETISYGANIALDLRGKALQILSVTGDVAFTGINYGAGRQITLKMTDDGSGRAVSFDANWVFVGTKPTTLTAGKVSVLTLSDFTGANTGVIAAWAEEE